MFAAANFFFIFGGVAHIIYVIKIWREGRVVVGNNSYQLHTHIKVEHLTLLTVHLILLVTSIIFLSEQSAKDLKGSKAYCDADCLAPAMQWFGTEALSVYNQPYLGPIQQESTDLYNKTMAACVQAGQHVPSLGEDCDFARKSLVCFVVCMIGEAVFGLIFNLLTFKRSVESKQAEELALVKHSDQEQNKI